MKKIVMLLVTGCAIGMLTGCGIPEEEHNAIIQSLETQHADEVDKLNADIAEQKDLVKNEKAKVRSSRIELDDATERIKGLQQKSAETSKDLAAVKTTVAKLESDLKSSNAKLAAAEERATEAETSYSTLDVEYQELKRRFEMFKKNMSSLGSSAPAAAAPAASTAEPSAEEPKTHSDKASSLLDQMGTL